jgi:hypothetical protein
LRKYWFWKNIGVPLATPLAVALLGVGFGIFSDRQKALDYDYQKKVELLREVVASKDRPDTAFLTAVGDRLTLSLERREGILAQGKSTGQAKRKRHLTPRLLGTSPGDRRCPVLQGEAPRRDHAARSDRGRELVAAIQGGNAEQQFEERAAYFFFGMLHSALIDFHASKGYQLYPRLWMREAFSRLGDRVDRLVFGAKESSPNVSGTEESALYKYFGAAAATYKNITDHSGEPTKAAVLFDFNLMLDGLLRKPGGNHDSSKDCLEAALRLGCEDFQEHLKDGTLNAKNLKLTIWAIAALDDYAFNKLFAAWDKGPDRPAEGESLATDIPAKIPLEPPSDYLFYPLRGWNDQDIRDLRVNREVTWEIIYAVVPKALK